MARNAPLPDRIDLNQADVESLTSLPGIGKELAKRIISFREEVQPFEAPIGVIAVRGISEKMYRQFADLVTALPPAEVDPLKTPEADQDDTQPEATAMVSEIKMAGDVGDTEPDESMNPAGVVEAPELQPDSAENNQQTGEDGYKIIWPGETETESPQAAPATDVAATPEPDIKESPVNNADTVKAEGYVLSQQPDAVA